MDRFHPQIKLILNCINNNEVGELISMDTSFGNNLKVCIEGVIFSRLRTDLSSSHITRIFLPTRYNNLEDNG